MIDAFEIFNGYTVSYPRYLVGLESQSAYYGNKVYFNTSAKTQKTFQYFTEFGLNAGYNPIRELKVSEILRYHNHPYPASVSNGLIDLCWIAPTMAKLHERHRPHQVVLALESENSGMTAVRNDINKLAAIPAKLKVLICWHDDEVLPYAIKEIAKNKKTTDEFLIMMEPKSGYYPDKETRLEAYVLNNEGKKIAEGSAKGMLSDDYTIRFINQEWTPTPEYLR